MASRLCHSLQHQGAALISTPMALSWETAYSPAKWLGALTDMQSMPTPLIMPSAIYLITWINTHLPTLEGWKFELADWWRTAFTIKWSPIQLAVWRRIGKVLQSKPAFYTLWYAANWTMLLLFGCNKLLTVSLLSRHFVANKTIKICTNSYLTTTYKVLITNSDAYNKNKHRSSQTIQFLRTLHTNKHAT